MITPAKKVARRVLKRTHFVTLDSGELERSAYRLIVHLETQPGLFRYLDGQRVLAGFEPTGHEWAAQLAWLASKYVAEIERIREFNQSRDRARARRR